MFYIYFLFIIIYGKKENKDNKHSLSTLLGKPKSYLISQIIFYQQCSAKIILLKIHKWWSLQEEYSFAGLNCRNLKIATLCMGDFLSLQILLRNHKQKFLVGLQLASLWHCLVVWYTPVLQNPQHSASVYHVGLHVLSTHPYIMGNGRQQKRLRGQLRKMIILLLVLWVMQVDRNQRLKSLLILYVSLNQCTFTVFKSIIKWNNI